MASRRRGANSVVLALPLLASAALGALPLLAGSSGCSSTSSLGPGADGGTADTSVTPTDTGAPPTDSSTATDAPSACGPGNVTGYSPSFIPPKAPVSACTQTELTSYGNCLDSNDPNSAACAPWFGADASASSTCKSCVADSKATDPKWGPLVDVGTSGSERQLNVSGCLSIVLHDTGGGCAGSFQALQECETAACADNCQGASSSALSTCIQEADNAGCSNYLSAAQCVYDAGTDALACFGANNSTFGQKFAAVAAVFCLQTDGGP